MSSHRFQGRGTCARPRHGASGLTATSAVRPQWGGLPWLGRRGWCCCWARCRRAFDLRPRTRHDKACPVAGSVRDERRARLRWNGRGGKEGGESSSTSDLSSCRSITYGMGERRTASPIRWLGSSGKFLVPFFSLPARPDPPSLEIQPTNRSRRTVPIPRVPTQRNPPSSSALLKPISLPSSPS